MTPSRDRRTFAELAKEATESIPGGALSSQAAIWGAEPWHLYQLKVGFFRPEAIQFPDGRDEPYAWIFPMRDANRTVRGLRFRYMDGTYGHLPGSYEGLFIPERLPSPTAWLLVAMDEIDTAILRGFGFVAVGRPSVSGGGSDIHSLALSLEAGEVVLLTDVLSSSQVGTLVLAEELIAKGLSVRVLVLPVAVDSVAAWKRQGATAKLIEEAIESAPLKRISTTTRKGGS